MRKFLLIATVFCFLVSCSDNDNGVDVQKPDIPLDLGDDKEVVIKPKQMWIDAHANFTTFATKAKITATLEKIKDTGFNEIYVDVKPGIGYALYDSDILPKLTTWGNEKVERDWDYLGYWLEEAERLEINVIASISVLGFGYTKTKEGLVYDDPKWDGKTQVALIKDSDGEMTALEDIRNIADVDGAMLDPTIPEVQSFVISIVEEVVRKYPKLKGICLDYCRWYGADYGFGSSTLSAFEAYSGEKISDKNQIITKTGGMGPLYNKWIEFRSQTITDLITNIRSKVKAIDSEKEIHLWASAQWSSRYSVGQNWASKNYKPKASDVYTDAYSKTGFADQLDVFSLGAYTEHIWKSENPGSEWSVENFVTTYSNYTQGACKVYGSIASYAYGNDVKAVSDAVYLCLKNTDGLMVFEISHVNNNYDQWAAIKDGISRVEKQ